MIEVTLDNSLTISDNHDDDKSKFVRVWVEEGSAIVSIDELLEAMRLFSNLDREELGYLREVNNHDKSDDKSKDKSEEKSETRSFTNLTPLPKSKYTAGYTQDEVQAIFKEHSKYINFDTNEWNKAMMCNTGMMIDDKMITYPVDVTNALKAAYGENYQWD